MNFIQNDIDKLFKEWCLLTVLTRDLVVYRTLFDKNAVDAPMFSANIKNSVYTTDLLAKLKELGLPALTVQQLPRSTLSIISGADYILPQMPYHKAIAFLGYAIAQWLKNNDE